MKTVRDHPVLEASSRLIADELRKYQPWKLPFHTYSNPFNEVVVMWMIPEIFGRFLVQDLPTPRDAKVDN